MEAWIISRRRPDYQGVALSSENAWAFGPPCFSAPERHRTKVSMRTAPLRAGKIALNCAPPPPDFESYVAICNTSGGPGISLGGDISVAAINDNGVVAGDGTIGSSGTWPSHAVVNSGGSWHDLGTLHGEATGVWGMDSQGDIVGSAMSGDDHPFYGVNPCGQTDAFCSRPSLSPPPTRSCLPVRSACWPTSPCIRASWPGRSRHPHSSGHQSPGGHSPEHSKPLHIWGLGEWPR